MKACAHCGDRQKPGTPLCQECLDHLSRLDVKLYAAAQALTELGKPPARTGLAGDVSARLTGIGWDERLAEIVKAEFELRRIKLELGISELSLARQRDQLLDLLVVGDVGRRYSSILCCTCDQTAICPHVSDEV